MLPTYFIINPRSGNGNLKRLIPLIRRHFTNSAIPFEIHVTTKPNDATEVARSVSKQFPIIVAVGGDGTVNEVVNGMVGSSNILGVLPTGSGNDFSKMFSLPHSWEEILSVIGRQKFQSIDVGKIKATSSKFETVEKYFINAAGIGLDAKVAYEAQKIPKLRGLTKYVVAAMKSLFIFNAEFSHVSCDEFESQGKHLLISVGNGKCAGGGFYLTPNAILDDGLLDICWAKNVSVLETLKIFPFVLKGKHGRFSKVNFSRTKKLNIKSEKDLPVHVDGEVIGIDQREISIEVVSKAIKVIVP